MAEGSPSEQFLGPSRRSYINESSRNSGNRTRIIMIVVGIIVLVALVAFAIIATGGQGDQEIIPTPTDSIETPTPSPTEPPEEDEEATPTPQTSPTRAATPAPTSSSGLNRADLSITVQNGGGVAGAATEASEYLEGLGYDVVSTGNADNFDYTETIIRVKSTMSEYLDQLEEDLSSEYTIGSATADYTGDADALVIIGAE